MSDESLDPTKYLPSEGTTSGTSGSDIKISLTTINDHAIGLNTTNYSKDSETKPITILNESK